MPLPLFGKKVYTEFTKILQTFLQTVTVGSCRGKGNLMKKILSNLCCLPANMVLVFMLLCFFLAVPGIVSAAETPEKQTIRVGYFQFDGYHDMSEDGVRSGYGYDFLRMIAPYAGFEYEYIGYNKSWSEMLQMLEDGQIDLLTSGQKTPEREEKYDFSQYSIGKSSTMLTTRADNNRYSVEDYSTFDGIRVGLLDGNSRNKSFEEYARENGFSYTAVYYDDQPEMIQALSEGDDIDAIVTSDPRALGDELIIDKFDASEYYVLVRKGDTALLDKVNRAIESLNSDNPDWKTTLSQKYYSASTDGTSEVLTVRERDYLESLSESGNALTVLLNPDRAPYSYFENGEAKGIYADLWKEVAKRYGISYRFIETASTEEYMDKISQGAAAIVFDSAFDNDSAEKLGYYMTPSYSTATFSCLFDIDEDKKARSVAMKRSTPDINKNYSALYEGMNVLEFDSYDECVQAVMEGKADRTYVYTYTAAKYVSEDVTGVLSYTPVNNLTTDFAIAVQQDQDPMLYSLMTRVAKSLNRDHVQAAIDLNTRFASKSNPISYFLHRYPFAIAVSIVCVFLLILSMILVHAHRERVRNEKQREWEKKQRYALSEAFEAANRANEAKSDFLSRISHDIRTPMNEIVGMTAVAKARLDDKERVADCLNKITMSGQQLMELINEVLDMSKIESRNFALNEEKFNLTEMINNLVDIMQPGIREKHHEFVVDVKSLTHENVIGDFARLQQVFVNIIGNSVKYTPPGGRIELEAEELKRKTDKIGTYRFIFRDNGVGMSEAFQKTIFEPFAREKNSSVESIQGTGLGMAISKNIVQMMGGSIEVESSLGKGSTFTVVVCLKLQETAIHS